MTQTLTMAPTGDWLTGTVNTAGISNSNYGDSLQNTTATYINPWPYFQPWVNTYCYRYEGPSRPIKLALSEVERLRAAAKRDAKLKAILAKFTDQIEITVDFE